MELVNNCLVTVLPSGTLKNAMNLVSAIVTINIIYVSPYITIGPVLGNKDFFTGLGIFFDTYSNHNGVHSVSTLWLKFSSVKIFAVKPIGFT